MFLFSIYSKRGIFMTGSNNALKAEQTALEEFENKDQPTRQETVTDVGSAGEYCIFKNRPLAEMEQKLRDATQRGHHDSEHVVELARTIGRHRGHGFGVNEGATLLRQALVRSVVPTPSHPFVAQLGRAAGNVADRALVEGLYLRQDGMPIGMVAPNLGVAATFTLFEVLARGGNNPSVNFTAAVEPSFLVGVRAGARLLASQTVGSASILPPITLPAVVSRLPVTLFGDIASRGDVGDAYRIAFLNTGIIGNSFRYFGYNFVVTSSTQFTISTFGSNYIQFYTNNILNVVDMLIRGGFAQVVQGVAIAGTSGIVNGSTHFIESQLGIHHNVAMSVPGASRDREIVAAVISEGGQELVLNTMSALTVRRVGRDVVEGRSASAVLDGVGGVIIGTALNCGVRFFARQVHGGISVAPPAVPALPAPAASRLCVLL
jgi:hypothetical protein